MSPVAVSLVLFIGVIAGASAIFVLGAAAGRRPPEGPKR